MMLFICFFFAIMYAFCSAVALIYAYMFGSWIGVLLSVLFFACTLIFATVITKPSSENKKGSRSDILDD